MFAYVQVDVSIVKVIGVLNFGARVCFSIYFLFLVLIPFLSFSSALSDFISMVYTVFRQSIQERRFMSPVQDLGYLDLCFLVERGGGCV